MARIEGLDRLKMKLRTLPLAVEAALKPIMEKTADEVVAMARNLVPIEDMELHDSINWVWGDAPPDARIVLGSVKSSKRGNLRITIFAGDDKAFYARWVEFGTAPHINGGWFAGTKHPGTRPSPYFYPSWRANRRKAKTRVSRAINKAAKRVAAGAK